MLRAHPRLGAVATLGVLLATVQPFGSGSAYATTAYQVPSTVAGDCSVDVTSQLLNWIATVPDNSVLQLGTNQCYRIEGTLELSNRKGLDLEGNGSTFRSFNAPTDQRAIWRLNNSSGFLLHNMSIVGSYANGGTYTSTLEHAHAIDLRGTNAEISAVKMSNLGGDCVYFGLYGTSTQSSGSVHDSSCAGTSRNAVSVTAGHDITVRNVSTTSIGYIVFDVEPNAAAGYGAQRVTFDHNTIGTYSLIAFSIVENMPTSDLAFTNNTVTGRGMKITAGPVSSTIYRPTNVTISGNSSSVAQAPAAMNLDNLDGLLITGNNIAMTTGTMAQVDASCQASVSANSYPGGTTQASITNTPATCPTPTITSFTPTSGPAGTTVTITGSGMIGATAVTIGGAPASFTSNSNTQITTSVPSGAVSGPITVTSPYGTAKSATSFSLSTGSTSSTSTSTPPVISSFSPASGPVGTTVTITGSGLTGATSVTVGGVSASYTVSSDTQVVATVPAGAASGAMTTTTPSGTATSSTSFSVTTTASAAPLISSFTPSSGPVGTRVTIYGSGFTGATDVTFNGTAATYTVDSGTQVTAIVPAAATSGPIRVASPAGATTSAKRFRVR